MSFTLYKIDWTESESGWGKRPDGTTLHKNMQNALLFIEECKKRERERNPSGIVPDCYSYPDKPELIQVPKDLYDFVMSLDEIYYWVSGNSWWTSTKPYELPNIIVKQNKPKSVDEMSVEELEEVLSKKKEELKKKQEPVMKTAIDFTAITNIVKDIIDSKKANPNYENGDDNQYLFEAVMEAYYGKDIWKWWNSL